MIKGVWRALFRRSAAGDGFYFKKELLVNIERVQVMEQRQNISLRLELSSNVPLTGYEDYMRAVREYNAAFDDHHACVIDYKADVAGQTRAKALILDQKYEALREKFVLLKPVLLMASKKVSVDGHV